MKRHVMMRFFGKKCIFSIAFSNQLIFFSLFLLFFVYFHFILLKCTKPHFFSIRRGIFIRWDKLWSKLIDFILLLFLGNDFSVFSVWNWFFHLLLECSLGCDEFLKSFWLILWFPVWIQNPRFLGSSKDSILPILHLCPYHYTSGLLPMKTFFSIASVIDLDTLHSPMFGFIDLQTFKTVFFIFLILRIDLLGENCRLKDIRFSSLFDALI